MPFAADCHLLGRQGTNVIFERRIGIRSPGSIGPDSARLIEKVADRDRIGWGHPAETELREIRPHGLIELHELPVH